MSEKPYKSESKSFVDHTKKQEAPIHGEVKVAEKPEKKAELGTEAQPFVIKTELDAYISSRLKSQPQNIEEIKVMDERLPSDAINMLELPKSIDQALKKRNLSPRWVNKDKRAIDRAMDVRGWVIFNRTLCPEIPSHNFTANGTVEYGDLILACMPATRAEALRRAPGEKSSERVKNLPINKTGGSEKIGYYKPAYSAERDDDNVVAGIQPDLPNENNE